MLIGHTFTCQGNLAGFAIRNKLPSFDVAFLNIIRAQPSSRSRYRENVVIFRLGALKSLADKMATEPPALIVLSFDCATGNLSDK